MEYKKEPFSTEEIPDFAMQPAKPAEDGDPTVYDRLYANMTEAQPINEAEEASTPIIEPAVLVSADPIEYVPEQMETIPVSLPKPSATKIVSAGRNQIERTLHYTDFQKLSPVIVYVEEDVLVPDVKPDLERILCLDGKCRLGEKNVHTGPSGTQSLRVAGDLTVQTLYVATEDGCPCVMSIETRIPFREDCPIDGCPNSYLTLTCQLESLEHEKINERKFRVKATIKVCPREYKTKDLRLFRGIEDPQVECLEDRVSMTDVAFRRTETMEFSDDFKLKDGMPDIEKILGYQVTVAENHKQISREKAVINASVICNAIYQGVDKPEFYQGKTEFTQFIKMDDDNAFSHPMIGSRVQFQINHLSLTPKKDPDGDQRAFGLDMDVDTTIEYYRELDEPVVRDLYHHKKEAIFDTEQEELMHYCGNGASEATVREILNIPDRYGTGCRVVYLTGYPVVKKETTEQGRCIIEGILPIQLVCISGEEEKTPFSIEQNLEFRAPMEIPDCKPGMN